MTLKQIRVIRLQSIKEALLDNLPEKGLIRFLGNNSNGKSIIVKTLDDALKGKLGRPKARKSLINWEPGNMWGELQLLRHDDVSLLIHIHLESSQTYAELGMPGYAPIRRYLADKNMSELIMKFGWHYNEEREISLNIHDSDDAILFFRTSHRLNFDVVDPVINDESAIKSLGVLTKLKDDTTKNKKLFQEHVNISKAAMSSISIWNIDEEEHKKERLKYLSDNLEKLIPPNIPKLEAVPNVVLLPDMSINIPSLELPPLIDARITIPDLLPQAKEYLSLLHGVCPTCGKEFCVNDECDIEDDKREVS
jgi:hypothetical protein